MANRRKFLAGVGALASGSAAAVGTGAFTNVSAERSVSVNVASDSNAYVGVDTSVGENANFSELNGGQVEVSLDGDGVAGEGINRNSNNGFLELFEVQNQGSNTAFFFVDPTTVTIDGNSVYYREADDYIDPQATNITGEGDFGGSLTGVYTNAISGTSRSDSNGDPTTPVFPPSKVAKAYNVVFSDFTDGDRLGHYLFTLEPGDTFDFGLVVQEQGGNGFGNVSIDLRASASAVGAENE